MINIYAQFFGIKERLTSNGPYQVVPLLTTAAIQLAWRASVDNILAAAVKNAGEVR